MKTLSPVASFAEGACARIRRLLDSYLDGELTVETTHELLEHMGRCPACARETAARQALRGAVRRATAVGAAPDPALEARIRAEVRRIRPRSGAPVVALLAAAVAVAAGIAVTRARPAGDAPFDAHAVRLAAITQAHCALGETWPDRPPAMAALQEDASEMGPLLPELAARAPGWGIVAAHRCLEQGESVLHVILRKEGASGPASLASLVVVAGRSAPGRSMTVTSRDGFTLVASQGRKATAFLVTSAGREEAVAMGKRALPVLAPLGA